MLHGERLKVPFTLPGSASVMSILTLMAHARLLETYPAKGDTLAEAPEEVQLRFSESVAAEFDPIKVSDDAGNTARTTTIDPENFRGR